MPAATSARSIACDHLVEATERFPDLPIGGPPAATLAALAPRDAALARAIDAAVRRRWLTLEAVVQSRLSRPFRELEPPLRAALLGGAGQLLLMRRAADHAIIHETVEWAKRRLRPGAGGLANAVLRAVVRLRDAGERLATAPSELGRSDLPLEDGAVLRLGEAVFPDDPVQRLSHQASLAPLLVQRWRAFFGPARAAGAALHGIAPPPVLLQGEPSAPDPTLSPHEHPGAFVLAEGAAPAEVLARHPRMWVQDPTSAAPVRATIGRAVALAVDLCAGRGTKTRQLAALHPAATILASDPDPVRAAALRAAFRDHPRVRIVDDAAVEAEVRRAAPAGADLVLLDVPCSNTGVLARRLEARYRFSEARLAELVAIQRAILRRGAGLRAPDGVLLYATCSLEPEENHGQWAWCAATDGLGLRALATDAALPGGGPGEPPERSRDGGGWALLGPPA